MFFKNALIYTLSNAFNYSGEELSEKLSAMAFVPCGKMGLKRSGFAPPIEGGELLTHAVGDFISICLKTEEKVLPSSVVNEATKAKIKAISDNEGRRISRKERDLIKEEVVFELLPRAFTKSKSLYAYIDKKDGVIVVDSSSEARAEELLTMVREALDGLSCIPFGNGAANCVRQSLNALVDSSLDSDILNGFKVLASAVLKDKDDGSVKLRNVDVFSSEVESYRASGMSVVKLAMELNGISFEVSENLSFSGIKFDTEITDKSGDRNPETSAEEFDADLFVMTAELRGLISAIKNLFGVGK